LPFSSKCTTIFVLQDKNNSWKPYCIVSFNMGWQDISKLYPAKPHVKTHNTVWLSGIISWINYSVCQSLVYVNHILYSYNDSLFGGVMVFNATFNNISAILWWSVLLVEETRVTTRKPLTCRNSLTNTILWKLTLSI
jgi:hypothetical protein